MVSEKKFEVGDQVVTSEGRRAAIVSTAPNSSLIQYASGTTEWEGNHEITRVDSDTEVHADLVAGNKRARILSTAEKLINGDRADAYGHPKENFGRIAALWNAQLGKKLSEPLTAEDVAYALVQLKMSRLANTPGHEDSLVDVAGYIALAGELK